MPTTRRGRGWSRAGARHWEGLCCASVSPRPATASAPRLPRPAPRTAPGWGGGSVQHTGAELWPPSHRRVCQIPASRRRVLLAHRAPQPCQHLEVFVRFNEPQPPALNIQMISKAYFKAKCCVVVRGDFRVIRSARITVEHSSLVVRQWRDSALREASDAQSAGRPRPRHWLSASDGGTTASMPGHDPWLPCGHASRLRSCLATTLGSPVDMPAGCDSHEGPRNASAGLNGAVRGLRLSSQGRTPGDPKAKRAGQSRVDVAEALQGARLWLGRGRERQGPESALCRSATNGGPQL